MGTVGRVYTVYLTAISAEFIDPVFAASPKHSFSMLENERFTLVFAKTVSINSGTAEWTGKVGVSLPTAVWTCRVYFFPPPAVWTYRV